MMASISLLRLVRLSLCVAAAAVLTACATAPRFPYAGELHAALPFNHTTKADIEKLFGNGPNAMNLVTKRERRQASEKARAMRCPEGVLDVYTVGRDAGSSSNNYEELWFRPDGKLCADIAFRPQ
jgi:hypothetical protein